MSGRSNPPEPAPEVSPIDEKLRKYSKANLSNWAAVTDWMSDEFDPMAFLYTDETPAGIDDVKPADSVEMLFARYDREDGVFKGLQNCRFREKNNPITGIKKFIIIVA